MEQDLCSADDLLRGEAPRVTQVAENGLHIKGKMNDGEPPPLTCIPFPAYNVDKGLKPLNNIFCSILHRDLEFTQNLGQNPIGCFRHIIMAEGSDCMKTPDWIF